MKHHTRILLALVAAGSVLTAQEPPKEQPGTKPPQSAPAKPQETKPKEAAAPAMADVKIPVTGLTKENAAKVQEALTSLTYSAYVCKACAVQETAAGTCPKCKGPLTAEKKPLLSKATASPETETVSVAIDQKHEVRLSAIERALESNAVKIEDDKLMISGSPHLVVKGATKENSAAIEKALKDAKLFDEVAVVVDEPMKEVHIKVRAPAGKAPSRAAIDEALAKSGLASAEISDIVWGHTQRKSS